MKRFLINISLYFGSLYFVLLYNGMNKNSYWYIPFFIICMIMYDWAGLRTNKFVKQKETAEVEDGS